MSLHEYSCEVTRVIDGDTMEVEIDLGFNLTYNTTLRLLGVDTHELNGEEQEKALEEKDFVKDWVKNQESIVVRTIEHDSFGRWLAYVKGRSSVEDKTRVLNKELLDNFEDVTYE